jgi:hypothetical protein
MIWKKMLALWAPEGDPAPTTTPPPTTTTDPKTAPPTDPKTPPTTALTADPKADPKQTTTDPKTEPKADPAKADPKSSSDPIVIKVPDGVQKDDAMLGEFTKLAGKLGLKAEGAQEIADFYFGAQQKALKMAEQAAIEQSTSWAEEARADKEIGGANFDATLKDGQRALRKLGNPDLVKLLNESGLGNHKEVIRFFAKVGKFVKEDGLPGGEGSGTGEKKDLADVLYTTMK